MRNVDKQFFRSFNVHHQKREKSKESAGIKINTLEIEGKNEKINQNIKPVLKHKTSRIHKDIISFIPAVSANRVKSIINNYNNQDIESIITDYEKPKM